MMRIVAVIILMTIFTKSALASPMTVRCSAEMVWGDQTLKIHIDIALPDKAAKHVFVSDLEGEAVVLPDTGLVGIGKIEISEQTGKAIKSRRHDFIVTRMPGDSNSLVGFYLVKSYVNSIRADLWQKEKAFIYFDSYNNNVVRGKCE